MTLALAALLEGVAVLALVSAGASLLAGLSLPALRRLPLAPARRADLAFALSALPAALVLPLAVAILVPGALDRLGLAADHCGDHGGHGHLCLVHPDAPAALPLLLGALALAGTGIRAGRWIQRRRSAARDLAALARMGRPSALGPDVLCLEGEAVLCHAVGAFRPRILLSARLPAELPAELLGAALAHERAHLHRRDVLVQDLLQILLLLAWPPLARRSQAAWSEAAEEAADAAAAARCGGLTVAAALVAVARFSVSARAVGLAARPMFEGGLAGRVERLLVAPPSPGRAWIPGALAPSLLALLLGAGWQAEALHHLAESVLLRLLVP